MGDRFDVDALIGELTLEEKASLVSGSGFWWTRRVERVGIPSIMPSDGPHGLRKQADRSDHVGLGASVPATCFPTASALVSYPFGHGLSYTTFADEDLVAQPLDHTGADAEPGDWRGAPVLEVSATVANTGPVAGKEVVQLYVGAPDASVSRAVRELKGFAKITLDPGQAETVVFTLHERDLSYWSTRTHGWVLEPGTFEIAVGASSRDLRLTRTVEVDGPPIAYPLDRSSTLAEWLDHPVGHEILIDVLRHSRAGDLSGIAKDPERVRMLGSFPVTRLTTLFGPTLDGDVVDQLLARLGEA